MSRRGLAVGMVCGEIMTNPGFCRNRYSDVVLVEARRLVMFGAGSELEVEVLRLVVEYWLGTGGRGAETCRGVLT